MTNTAAACLFCIHDLVQQQAEQHMALHVQALRGMHLCQYLQTCLLNEHKLRFPCPPEGMQHSGQGLQGCLPLVPCVCTRCIGIGTADACDGNKMLKMHDHAQQGCSEHVAHC